MRGEQLYAKDQGVCQLRLRPRRSVEDHADRSVQDGGLPFSINDVSLQQATPEWQQKARAAIEGCDVFIVLLGDHTHQAQGVKRELRMARDLGKKRFQLRKKGQFPTPLNGGGEVVAWKWKNLRTRLSSPGSGGQAIFNNPGS